MAVVGVAIGACLSSLAGRVPLPVALAASSILVAGSVAHADDDRELTAREAFAAGRYQEALDIYAKLFAETLHPTYLRNVGRCHQMLGNADQAIKTFREYLRRAADLPPQQRSEVEGFIAEMEALKKTQDKAAADRAATTAGPASTSPTSAAAGSPPTIEAQATTGQGAGADAGASPSSHRRQLGAVLRGDVGVYPGLGLVIAPGLSYGLSNQLELEAGALVGHFKGGWAAARFFFSTGAVKPLASLGLPLFSASGSLRPGVQPGVGLQWDPDRHFGVLAEMTVSYFPGASENIAHLYLIPVLGIQGRF